MDGERLPLLPSTAPSRPARARRIALVLVVAALSLGFLVFYKTASSVADAAPATSVFPVNANGQRDLLSLCEERFTTQNLDHLDPNASSTFEQRYFVCGNEFFDRKNGVIFFYTGNEANVELYVNHTGLMWENAKAFGALMVFAEHRYFGKSVPFGRDVLHHMQHLSSVQALGDFAVLIEFLNRDWNVTVPVIGFGGSYGGMLATWFRLKYPHLMDGVIAASAPALSFLGDPSHPNVDTNSFRRIVAFDMSPAAGSSENCIPNIRKAIGALTRLSQTLDGRARIGKTLRMCNPEIIQSPRDAQALIYSAIGAFGNLAMCDYPYPTSYLTEGLVELPAYPVRSACSYLAPEFGDDDTAVLAALRDAVGVFYNATGAMPCYFPVSAPSDTNQTIVALDNFMGYLTCVELYMPMSSDGLDGVFPVDPLDIARDDANCMATWGVHLRPNWASTEYGGLAAIRASSNIVFSNGNYDPLSGTGVLETLSDTVVALGIDGGAHHVDLFFQHPMDPPSLTQARKTEKKHMRKWIREFYARTDRAQIR